ncbi:MAG: NAD(P)H-hydrate epimerase [Candidatus Marinimicrobia bacterium]|nr:NAD(P)H-hydrate epimerase [Candidatus Neomarinimicrobiota bacterium]MCF7828124.1 NAD(P)H-hydrate epimerase [Candidatus Neomarinimicrobiota bacterium]MCF7879701.1 NAD(P)H-hydrate epimerase [Candidatus Neomarinimicrobiota bacterium]
MTKIDRAMFDVSQVSIYQMMERAGEAVAEIAENYTSEDHPKVAVLVGKGNNGGGALSAARQLANRGAELQVILTTPVQEIGEVPATQLHILQSLHPGTPVHDMSKVHADNLPPMPKCDIIIDGLLGYNIRGVPREPISTLITIANNAEVPTISVDMPSGLHPDTGEPAFPTILACATVTLALPKQGFRKPAATSYLGELYLADIGIPPSLIEKNISVHNFPQRLPSIMYLVNKHSGSFSPDN